MLVSFWYDKRLYIIWIVEFKMYILMQKKNKIKWQYFPFFEKMYNNFLSALYT